jgi:enoyl-CoA hydratase/carnithine racemase
MAMPETAIGLFPDVGGGYFLSRCPGHTGEWLALTGTQLDGPQAIALGLADHAVAVDQLLPLWEALAQLEFCDSTKVSALVATFSIAFDASDKWARSQIDQYFSLDSVMAIVQALAQDSTDWARHTAEQLRQRSPLMLHVAFEQIRCARQLTLAEDLRMERDMMRHVFFPQHLARSGAQTEAAEGIRALVIDKDNKPTWQPTRIEDVTPEMVQPFFKSPWVAHSHPLRQLDIAS